LSPLKPENASDPEDYIGQIDEPRRDEIVALDRLITEEAPALDRHLQAGMLAYGSYHYRYASGREGDWFLIGLASQKRYISLYVCATDGDGYVAESFRERLPEASIGKSCVRFKRLSDVDEAALRELVRDTARRFAADPGATFAQ
jgi:hypothetical protein